MKTRFSSLVNVKKNIMQKSENELKKASLSLKVSEEALHDSIEELHKISLPKEGQIADFLANRELLHTQRELIKHNQEWVQFNKNQLEKAKEQLKLDTIEYEKFKYIEYEEEKILIKNARIKESKELDEVALMSYSNRR